MTAFERNLNEFVARAHANARVKGFWDGRDVNNVHSCLAEVALFHSEVSEATEALLKEDKDNLKEELADVCIRVFDSCGARSIRPQELYDAYRVYDYPSRSLLEEMAFLHILISNASEVFRHGQAVDGAFALILARVADLAQYWRIDLEKAVLSKMEVNEQRAHMHGKRA